MKLWADFYDPDGRRIGPGPVRSVVSAEVTRILDGAGSIGFDVPGKDRAALKVIDNKRRFRLFVEQENRIRELGRGIVEKIGAKDSAGGWTRTVDGPDNLAELKYESVLLGRKYDAQPVQGITDDLLGLVSGWTRYGSSDTLVSARFDGTSVLGAIQGIVKQQGIHFRQREPGVLEIGALGQPNGLRAVNVTRPSYTQNDRRLKIETLTQIDDSEDLCNWLVPLGGGRGDAALTLELATRTGPYQILNLPGPDGRTLYYLQAADSITRYGRVMKVGTFKNIVPITNSLEDQIAAANALYDMAVAWLDRYKEKYRAYGFALRDVRVNLLPGDKIRVRYIGRINDGKGDMVDYRSIDEDMWLLEVRESYSAGGVVTTPKVATVDRYQMDETEVILGALEELRINNVAVDSYPTKYAAPYVRTLDSTHPAVVPLEFDNGTARLVRCNMRLLTRPFRATSKGAASGGGSTTSSGGGQTSSSGGGATVSSDALLNGGVGTIVTGPEHQNVGTINHNHVVGQHFHEVTISNHTHTVDDHTHNVAAHTHPPDYGIEDDSQYPDTVRIAIDGTDYTAALGGPWGVGGVAVNEQLEISAQVNASGSLQTRHTITITCDGGQGEVEVTLIPVEVIQSIERFE